MKTEKKHKTSTCILVDADEIKEARNWIEIHNGKIGTFFEDVSGENLKIECSFRQLVSQNIRAAHQGDTAAQFVKDARLLAAMLEKAAKRVERESANAETSCSEWEQANKPSPNSILAELA